MRTGPLNEASGPRLYWLLLRGLNFPVFCIKATRLFWLPFPDLIFVVFCISLIKGPRLYWLLLRDLNFPVFCIKSTRLFWLLLRGLMAVFLQVILVSPVPPSLLTSVAFGVGDWLRRTRLGFVGLFIFTCYNCFTPLGFRGPWDAPYPGLAPGAMNRSTPLGLVVCYKSRSAFHLTKRNALPLS